MYKGAQPPGSGVGVGDTAGRVVPHASMAIGLEQRASFPHTIYFGLGRHCVLYRRQWGPSNRVCRCQLSAVECC